MTEAKYPAAATPTEGAGFPDPRSRKRMAAGMLLCNIEGQVLLVESTYKPHWELPGGVVEADESPRDAAQREIVEELGLGRSAGRLLVLDCVPPAINRPDGVIAVFDTEVLSSTEIARIVVPPEELRGFDFLISRRSIPCCRRCWCGVWSRRCTLAVMAPLHISKMAT